MFPGQRYRSVVCSASQGTSQWLDSGFDSRAVCADIQSLRLRKVFKEARPISLLSILILRRRERNDFRNSYDLDGSAWCNFVQYVVWLGCLLLFRKTADLAVDLARESVFPDRCDFCSWQKTAVACHGTADGVFSADIEVHYAESHASLVLLSFQN